MKKFDKVKIGVRMDVNGYIVRDDLLEWMQNVTTTLNRIVKFLNSSSSETLLDRGKRRGSKAR